MMMLCSLAHVGVQMGQVEEHRPCSNRWESDSTIQNDRSGAVVHMGTSYCPMIMGPEDKSIAVIPPLMAS